MSEIPSLPDPHHVETTYYFADDTAVTHTGDGRRWQVSTVTITTYPSGTSPAEVIITGRPLTADAGLDPHHGYDAPITNDEAAAAFLAVHERRIAAQTIF